MLLTGAAKRQREEYMELTLSMSHLPCRFHIFIPCCISTSTRFSTGHKDEDGDEDEVSWLTFAGLPFQSETNTGFGILFKTYLDVTLFSYEGDEGGINASNANSDAAKEAKGQALDFVEQSFENVKSPKLEVERGFRFWDTVSSPSLSLYSPPSTSNSASTSPRTSTPASWLYIAGVWTHTDFNLRSWRLLHSSMGYRLPTRQYRG